MLNRFSSLTPDRPPYSFFQRSRLSLFLSLIFFSASCQAQTSASQTATSTSLPSLGDNSELPAGAERRIGDRIAASIYRDADYIDDPVLVDYVQSIWQPLLASARTRGELHAEIQERFAWEFFLIRDRTVNAFALPGGYFGMHLGLVGVVNSRDELAAVLAHEISHVTQRHISRLLTQQSRQAPWMIGAMILGALAASKNPQAANAAVIGGQALAAQGQLDFSRDMEREADRVGLGVMMDAGFDNRGVSAMFEKLQQAARLNDNGSFPYLRSHPLTTQRIAEAQARNQLSPPPAPLGFEAGEARFLHAMMAARAQVLVEPGVDFLRTMVTEGQRTLALADVAPGTSKNAGALYAGAFAAAKQRDFGQAQVLASRLKNLAGGNARATKAVDLLTLEIDLQAAGKPPAQWSSLKFAPTTARAELLLAGRALLAAGRAPEVADRLQSWVSIHPKDASAWQLLSAAYLSQGQQVRAVRADAEARYAQLDYPGALDRFRAAQEIMRARPASADFVEGSIVDTRARQLDALVKEQALQDKAPK